MSGGPGWWSPAAHSTAAAEGVARTTMDRSIPASSFRLTAHLPESLPSFPIREFFWKKIPIK